MSQLKSIILNKSVAKIVVFPGQGRFINGNNFPISENQYSFIRDQIPGFTLKDKEFTSTKDVQPASIFLTQMLIKELKRNCGIDLKKIANFTMGHSLGEYSSLLLNDIIPEDKQYKIILKRGELMEKCLAHKREKYGMTALLFDSKIFDNFIKMTVGLLAEFNTISISNINSAQQIVISGEVNELEKFIEMLKPQFKFKKSSLSVNLPFHNNILSPSIIPFKNCFTNIKNQKLKIPIVSNLTGEISKNSIKSVEQFIACIDKPVQFKKSMETILSLDEYKYFQFINIGPNSSITKNLIDKISNEKIISNFAISQLSDLDDLTDETQT